MRSKDHEQGSGQAQRDQEKARQDARGKARREESQARRTRLLICRQTGDDSMRATRRSLLLAFCLAAANVPAPLHAIEAQDSAPQLQRLVAEARDLITVIHTQKQDVRNMMGRPEQPPPGDPTRMFSNSFEYRELRRSAGRMTEIGNDVYKLASRCGADGKQVADGFKSSVRRLNTHVNRIESSSSPTT